MIDDEMELEDDNININCEHNVKRVKLKINKIGKYSCANKPSKLDESLCSSCKNNCKDDSMIVDQCSSYDKM